MSKPFELEDPYADEPISYAMFPWEERERRPELSAFLDEVFERWREDEDNLSVALDEDAMLLGEWVLNDSGFPAGDVNRRARRTAVKLIFHTINEWILKSQRETL